MAKKARKGDQKSFIIASLSHALRRRILVKLADGSASSPNQLSQELDEPLGNVAYHVSVLSNYGCLKLVKTRPRRGAVEHFYKSTVEEPWALEALGIKKEVA